MRRILVVFFVAAAGCGSEPSASLEARSSAATSDTGALVKMEMSSTVGVLLDDVPAGPVREAAAAEAMAQSTAAWTDRAMRQVKLTYYRLVFRQLYWSGFWNGGAGGINKGPLPLPPKSIWHVPAIGNIRRGQVNGHDLVMADYSFFTHLVTDPGSPGAVEPNLATTGGTWDETFTLPIDPELLLQRTGYSCMDENEYPPFSVFEENTYYFYDDSCSSSNASQKCHITQPAQFSCVQALNKYMGAITTNLHFTRLDWASNQAVADANRIGTIVSHPGADFAVVQEDMVNENRVYYRYYPKNSCDIAEGSIDKAGWHQFLTFSAVVRNDGNQRVHIGDPTDPTNPWAQANVFQFSPCHGHYHFSHYGVFGFGGAPGSKKAFCLEDTNRFHNDESTPLTSEHNACTNQGIGHGWGDEYEFGLPGQGVDVTAIVQAAGKKGVTSALTFDSNIDRFICEGRPMPSDQWPDFIPTSFTTDQGAVVSRGKCDSYDATSADAAAGFTTWSTWNFDNHGEVQVTVKAGDSFVTRACDRGQVGARRDCDFKAGALKTCTPGAAVSLSCTSAGAPQLLRICERSAALGIGIPCTYRDSAVTAVVGSSATPVSFTCPAVRPDDGAVGYSVFQAPLLASQGSAAISCSGW